MKKKEAKAVKKPVEVELERKSIFETVMVKGKPKKKEVIIKLMKESDGLYKVMVGDIVQYSGYNELFAMREFVEI